MTDDFSQRLRALDERYQQGAAEFRKTSREFEQTLTATREKYPPMSAKQQEDLADHYRSGRAGRNLRDVQLKVDRGEISWEDIKRGERDPDLTEKYYKSFKEGGRLLRAAVDGESIDHYLPDEGPQEEPPADDDYFDRRNPLADGR